MIQQNININPTPPNNNEGKNGQKDYRKHWLFIILPGIIAGVFGYIYLIKSPNSVNEASCEFKDRIENTIILIDNSYTLNHLDSDKRLILKAHREKFEDYLDQREICKDFIEKQDAENEITFIKNLIRE